MGPKMSRGGGGTQFDAHLETWTKSVAKALAHPTPVGILERLEQVGQTSPSEAAGGGTASLPAVAYHMRELKTAGLIRPTITRPARGAVEHFYELTDRGRAAVRAIDKVIGPPPPAPRRGGEGDHKGHRARPAGLQARRPLPAGILQPLAGRPVLPIERRAPRGRGRRPAARR